MKKIEDEVVRCKDCKWWVATMEECGYVWENQGRILRFMKPDHYCGWGEKKPERITNEEGYAPKIVRCAECEYWDGYYCGYNGEAVERKLLRFESDYCSRGEKKDECNR